jgi:hypothetical protein
MMITHLRYKFKASHFGKLWLMQGYEIFQKRR